MTPSLACAKFIQGFETCRLFAYLPTAFDRWTIGWGETGPAIMRGTRWTLAQADASFAARLASFGQRVAALITGPTTQAQFDALVSLAYNIGVGSLATSTLLRLHNAGDFADVPAQFLRWNKQGGYVLAGLTRRRQAEADMYRGGS